MEAVESYKEGILNTLKSQLDAFQNQFVDETTKCRPISPHSFGPHQKLTYLIDIATANQAEHELSQAQKRARQDARRIAALEREIAYLRGPDQDHKDEGTQTSRPQYVESDVSPLRTTNAVHDQTHQAEAVNDEDLYQLQCNYAKLEQDYAHLAVAHDRLEDRCQSYQETLRQWREWHDKYGKRISRKKAGPSSTQDLHSRGSQSSALSAPIVFLPPDEIEHQPVPRTTSLQTSIGLGGRKEGPQDIVHPRATEPPQAAVGESTLEGHDGTETSDETQDALGSTNKLVDKPLSSLQAAPFPETSEGSSPIIVSARPVKRKRIRHPSPTSAATKVPTPANERPGTVEKPVQIKSDQSSSSPLAAVRCRTLDEHDSMDLDEVGERNFTPRKRQRVDPTRYLELEPIHFTRTKALLDGYISRKNVTDEQAGSDVDTHDKDTSPPLCLDEESCKRAGEKYAANLWKGQLERKSGHLQGNTNDVVVVPEHVRGNSRRMRASQHNQKLHERQAQTKAKQRSTPDGVVNPSETPKGAIYRDRLNNVGADGLPTPVTSIKRPDTERSVSNGNGERRTPSILRPTDPNTHILPRTSGSTKKRLPPPSRRDHGAAAVHLLSEDGDVREKPSATGVTKAPRASEAEHRLEGLLSEPLSAKPFLPWESPTVGQKTYMKKADAPSPKPQTSVAKFSKRPVTPVQLPANVAKTTTPRSFTAKPTGLLTKPTTRSVLASVSPQKAPTSPEKGPIRFRPLGTLDLKHFKLNPARNSGYNYAYREVIRKRKERKCLPGCTRPDCCGDTIRKMLAIGGALPSNYTNLFSSSPEDPGTDGAEDHRLLKEYMGDNYREWRKMRESEKKEEWMRAQEWNFGKAFGRHKDNGRQATPPGFWRVEMASTQEMVKDEEEAEKMERERVEGMWREAMRKDGAYLFADE